MFALARRVERPSWEAASAAGQRGVPACRPLLAECASSGAPAGSSRGWAAGPETLPPPPSPATGGGVGARRRPPFLAATATGGAKGTGCGYLKWGTICTWGRPAADASAPLTPHPPHPQKMQRSNRPRGGQEPLAEQAGQPWRAAPLLPQPPPLPAVIAYTHTSYIRTKTIKCSEGGRGTGDKQDKKREKGKGRRGRATADAPRTSFAGGQGGGRAAAAAGGDPNPAGRCPRRGRGGGGRTIRGGSRCGGVISRRCRPRLWGRGGCRWRW